MYNLLDHEACPYGHRAVCGTITGCRDRVLAVSLVHDAVDRACDSAEVDLGPFLHRLLGSLVLGSDLPGQVRYDLDIEPARFRIDRAVPLGLLLSELAADALDQAANHHHVQEVRILLRQGHEALEMTIAPFRPIDELEPTRAQILRALASQLDVVWSEPTPGALGARIPSLGPAS